MRNNFHYGFDTRLTAVILTLLMVLSLGGFVLRDTGMGVDEPMVFDESYGTPAPEATEVPAEATEAPAETAAPEATEAPAEDTPAPEATEAPAEATPIPETDSGTDTNTDTSEPETTADPQMTPAPETEATAAPEGDTPANEAMADGPATIAAVTLSANLAFDSKGEDGKYTYTLTLNNVECEFSTPIDNAVQFESAGQYSGISGYTQARIESVSGSENVIKNPASDTQVQVNGTFTQVTITFTVTPTDGNAPVFGIKFSSSLISPGVQLVCTADGKGNISTVKKYIKKDAEEKDKNDNLPAGMNFAPSVSGMVGPGSGTTTPGGDTGGKIPYAHTYNLVYHLNLPGDTTAEPGEAGKNYVLEGSDTDPTFALKTITGKEGDYNGVKVGTLPVLDGVLNSNYTYAHGGTTYYFAGWNTSKTDFNGYNNITYPVTWISTDSAHSRWVAPGTKVAVAAIEENKVSDEEPVRYKVDLYAVWAPLKNSSMFGYSMSITGAKLEGIDFNGSGWDDDDNGQILGNNGLSSGGAQKYSVLDGGWSEKNNEGKLSMTSAAPVAAGYDFVAWFNKKPGNADLPTGGKVPTKGDFLLTNGMELKFAGGNSAVYSIDALWGRVTPAENKVVTYDEKEHHVMFRSNADKGLVDVPKADLEAADGLYEAEKDDEKGAHEVIEAIIAGSEATYTVKEGEKTVKEETGHPSVPVTFKDAGVYTYSATGKLVVPGKYYAGGDTNSPDKTIDFTTPAEGTLTILPKLTLNVHKIVDGGAPDEDYTFKVEKTSGGKIVDSGEGATIGELTELTSFPVLTAKADGYDSVNMWFAKDGTYEFTVTEKEGSTHGMTYDTTPKNVTVTVENYKIKSVEVDSAEQLTDTSGVSDATATVDITNTYQTGSLTVTKKVDGYVEDGKEFSFTVTLKNGETPVSGTFGEGKDIVYFDSKGQYTFTLEKDGSRNLKGLPPGVTYTVEETADDDFTTDYHEAKTGTIVANETVQVTVTNTRNTGSLKVTKIVYHEPGSHTDDGYTTDGPFTFTVTPKDPTVNVDLTGVTASVGTDILSDEVKAEKSSVKFTMKDGDLDTFKSPGKSVTLTGLPAGLEYTVTEESVDGYATTYSPSAGTVKVTSADTPAEVTVNNLHYPGALVITKNVVDPYLDRGGTGDTGTDIMDTDFIFSVKLTKEGLGSHEIKIYDDKHEKTEDAYVVTASDTPVEIRLKNGWYAVIQSLPVGTGYTVTETVNPRYTVKATGNSGTIAAGTSGMVAHAAFVNTFETGDLTIRKNVEGADTLSRRYTVELTFSTGSLSTGWDAIKAMLTQPNLQAELSKFDEGVTVTGPVDTDDGGLKFTLSLASGKTYRLEDLPAGLGYAITEKPATGFEAAYTAGCSGTIVYNATQAAVITNTFKPGSLKITKNMEGDGNAYRSFSIDVTLGPEGDETVKGLGSVRAVYDGGGARYIPCTDGKITVSLRKDQSVTLSGLPQGASYEVKEEAVADYSASYSGNASGAIGAEVQEVTVINSYQAGTLQVTKKVIGAEEGEDTGAFNFTVRLSDTSITGTRNGLEFTGGVAAFTLTDGQSISIPGLKAGVEFTVTEDEAEGYETTYAVRNPDGTTVDGSNTGTIVKDGTVTVTVTNTKPGGGGPGGGGGGGGVLPPVTWPTATPEGTATPGPTATPDPNATPTPGGTPGPGQTSQPFGTPQPTRKPGTTSQPFTPGTGGGTGGSGGPTAPATGDETAIAPWAILLALSAAGLAAVMAVGRRRRGRG